MRGEPLARKSVRYPRLGNWERGDHRCMGDRRFGAGEFAETSQRPVGHGQGDSQAQGQPQDA